MSVEPRTASGVREVIVSVGVIRVRNRRRRDNRGAALPARHCGGDSGQRIKSQTTTGPRASCSTK